MAKTIPQLTDATTVNASDELIISQGGITKRATGAELAKGLNTINGTISAKDFGAVGDGVTDDTAALLSASAAGARFLQSGNYLITQFSLIDDVENWSGTGNFVYNGATLPVGPVTSFLVLNVPSVFPTIQDAVNFAEAKQLKDAGFIQIKIADGIYNNLTQIEPAFPNGSDRIEIIGNTANKHNVQLNFSATNNQCGFLFQRGSGIYKIDGMVIAGVGGRTGYGTWNNQVYGAGIMANYNSQVLVGSNVEVTNFYYGIASRYGSSVRCESGVVVRNAGDCGFFAYGAAMDCQDCQAYDVAHTAEGLGFGFTSEAGAFMDCSRSNSSGNYKTGFYANGGRMWAKEITSDNNQGDGVLSINGGNIECNPPTSGVASNSYSNGGCGYLASNGSYINANSCLSDDNTADGYKAQNNSVIDITAASSSNNTGHGYFSVDSSGMTGNSANASSNAGDGFRADTQSYFRGSSYSSNSNSGWGYFAQNLSYMNIPSSGGAGNTLGFDNPAVAGTPGNNGSYIQN